MNAITTKKSESSTRLFRNSIVRFVLFFGSAFYIGHQLQCSTTSLVDTTSSVSDNPMTTSTSATSTDTSTGLAYQQSFGYFDRSVISDDEWKLRQLHARNATHHRYVGHPRRQWDKPNLWYYNNYDPIFSCPFQKRVKGLGDGPKWTCDPHRIRNVVNQRKAAGESEPHCILYSVGSNGNYQWEDGMFNELGGDGVCEIHIFDYSQNYTRNKNPLRNMHFHQWGLKAASDPRKGPFVSFPEILDRLGHKGKTIDMFKIDCEGCEWATYQDWIGYDIRQILVETHKLPDNKTHGLGYFDSFLRNDFMMFSKEVNPWGGGQFVEFSYIKLHKDFLDGHKNY